MSAEKLVSQEQVSRLLPLPLRTALTALRRELPAAAPELYLVGGTLRDLLLGREVHDIDLCVPRAAVAFARALAERAGAAFVCLDEGEDVARVVLPAGPEVDIAAFREATVTIEQDLQLRDFTLNALALDLAAFLDGDTDRAAACIDPCGAQADIAARVIRPTHEHAFAADPLRMLRAYRLAATLDCRLALETRALVRRDCSLIVRSAGERVASELNALLLSSHASSAMQCMAEDGLLFAVIPELALGRDVSQPRAFHHLNVLEHNLEALKQAELLVARPGAFFPDCAPPLQDWLAAADAVLVLKWAALLHDVGKPAARQERQGRLTFYQHEQAGVQLVRELAQRLRWSTRHSERVCRLVALHMRPYQLLHAARSSGGLSLRACIRAVQAVDEDLPGLLLLCQADTLAGRGERRPADLEAQVAWIADRLLQVRAERVMPVQTAPPLLTGHNLMDRLGLQPGPLFKKILGAVALARMEGGIATRREALALAREMAAAANREGGV